MTCLYPNLVSASDWLKQISLTVRPIRSTNKIWIVSRHQYRISALLIFHILGDSRAAIRVDKMFVVKFKCHEHFIDPTSCPRVSEVVFCEETMMASRNVDCFLRLRLYVSRKELAELFLYWHHCQYLLVYFAVFLLQTYPRRLETTVFKFC